MNQHRRRIDEIDAGPTFDADSIHLPPESDGEGPGRRTAHAKGGSTAPLLVGAVVLGVAGGAAAFFFIGGGEDVIVAPVVEVTPSPDPEPLAAAEPEAAPKPPPAPEVKPEPKPAPKPRIEEAPAPKPAPAVADAPKPPPAPAVADKPKARPAPAAASERAPPAWRRRRAPAVDPSKLDDALAKLDDLDDRPSPTAAAGGTEEQGGEAAAPRAALPAGPEAECARGDARSCVRAGEAAELGSDADGGAKARQFYGVGCTKGLGEACWRLARLVRRGIGGPKNASHAGALEKKACDLGHRASCDAGADTDTPAPH